MRFHTHKWLAVLITLLLALMLAGCDVGALSGQMGALSPDDARRAAALDSLGGRLLILGADGNIYTASPSGRDRVAITDDASSAVRYQQPTWSPDGALIAWTELRSEGDSDAIRLVTSNADGGELAQLDAPFPPFYFYWSPDSSRLAYLSNWNRSDNLQSMALRLVEIGSDEAGMRKLTARTLAEGQPFYFSWSPDSQRLLTHVGNEQLDLREIDGGAQSLPVTSGEFAAPQWSFDGNELIYAINEDDLQKLIITDIDGNRLREITDYDARITFGLSPSAGGEPGKLAYVVTEDSRSGVAALGPLYVVDLATQATRELSSGPVIAFFWSPDGERLAYLTLERGAGAAQSRWYVWDGNQSRAYDAIRPSARFLQQYLTFFDQYAQSMRIWSPDSRAFTYAGANSEGVSGIWVQMVGEAEPVLVDQGMFAAWSPRE